MSVDIIESGFPEARDAGYDGLKTPFHVALVCLVLLASSCPALAHSAKAGAGGTSGAIAACIVRRQPAFGAAWLNTLPVSPEEAALIETRRKDVDACLKKSGLALDALAQPELRQAVASELLERDFPRLPATAPFPPGTAPWFAVKIISAPDAKFDRAALRTANFANCVALAQWRETGALVAADPASAAAEGAAAALRPALGDCLTYSVTVRFKVASLRLMLADAVFHIMSTASLIGPAPAKL